MFLRVTLADFSDDAIWINRTEIQTIGRTPDRGAWVQLRPVPTSRNERLGTPDWWLPRYYVRESLEDLLSRLDIPAPGDAHI